MRYEQHRALGYGMRYGLYGMGPVKIDQDIPDVPMEDLNDKGHHHQCPVCEMTHICPLRQACPDRQNLSRLCFSCPQDS